MCSFRVVCVCMCDYTDVHVCLSLYFWCVSRFITLRERADQICMEVINATGPPAERRVMSKFHTSIFRARVEL